MAQWLRIWASTAGDLGSIPSWGTKILHAMQYSQKKKKKDAYRDRLIKECPWSLETLWERKEIFSF